MKWLWRSILILLGLLLVCVVFFFSVNGYVYSRAAPKIKESITTIPVENPPRIAIVFGAGLRDNNSEPSAILYDRILTAVELYRAGRVRKIVVSGDNRKKSYDEPTVMKETAINLGVPAENIIPDYAGRRTYDTCFRAKEIFEIERAILVTQEFHLPRALYLCNALGVESIGVKADRRKYRSPRRMAFRESFSIFSAWFETNIYPWKPVLGKKEPIQP